MPAAIDGSDWSRTSGRPDSSRPAIRRNGSLPDARKAASRIIGTIKPAEDGQFELDNRVTGGNIPREYIPSVEKGFRSMLEAGTYLGAPRSSLTPEGVIVHEIGHQWFMNVLKHYAHWGCALVGQHPSDHLIHDNAQ